MKLGKLLFFGLGAAEAVKHQPKLVHSINNLHKDIAELNQRSIELQTQCASMQDETLMGEYVLMNILDMMEIKRKVAFKMNEILNEVSVYSDLNLDNGAQQYLRGDK